MDVIGFREFKRFQRGILPARAVDTQSASRFFLNVVLVVDRCPIEKPYGETRVGRNSIWNRQKQARKVTFL